MYFLSWGRSQSNPPPSGPFAHTEIATEKEQLFLGSQTPEPTLRAQDQVLNAPQGMEGARKRRALGHSPPPAQTAPGPGRKPRGRRCEGKEGAQGPEEETHVGKEAEEAPPPLPESGGRGSKKTLRHPVGHPESSQVPPQGSQRMAPGALSPSKVSLRLRSGSPLACQFST